MGNHRDSVHQMTSFTSPLVVTHYATLCWRSYYMLLNCKSGPYCVRHSTGKKHTTLCPKQFRMGRKEYFCEKLHFWFSVGACGR